MSTTSELTVSIDHKKVMANEVVQNALANNFPFAIWRKPLENNYFISVDLDKKTIIKDFTIEELVGGFIFSPFIENNNYPTHFIKNNILIEVESGKTKSIVQSKNITENQINTLFNGTGSTNSYYYSKPAQQLFEKEENSNYINFVHKSINGIKEGLFEKIVPSRKTQIQLDSEFNPFDFFNKLEKAYPNAFIYLVSLPDTGTWLGATPENLISIQENKTFKTTALAGTQKYIEGMDLVDAAWRQKEIEEQAMVSRYIINCFKKIRLREFDERGPKTVKAGNLIHLRTDFIVDMEEVNFPQLGSVMLDLLHPTSAVCGMPKESSMEFINQNEGFDREYFSGYLGPINTKNCTDIFVNLRCMKLNNDQTADIYAGAGVTIDSNPEKEWLETEMKMETLLKLM